MLEGFFQQRNRHHLTDERYTFLFSAPPDEERVCVDCETTGLDPRTADLLVIGAVRVKDNKVLTSRKLELFCKPSDNHLKTTYMLHPMENAIAPEQAVLQFVEFAGARPLIGYYLEFDVAIINKYLKSVLGITLPNKQIEVSGIYHDKKQLTIPQGIIDLRFDTLLKELNLPVMGKHDAFNDALMTALMYIKLQSVSKL